jgi:nucleotide-binding universal stress UspA family protein
VLGSGNGDALVQAPSDAALLVVPAGLPGLTTVLAAACCPVAAVPEMRNGAAGGGVVLGAAPWTEEPVYEAAFRIAEQRGSRLTAARVWHLDAVSLLGSSPAQLRAWDRAYERSREALDADLAAWRLAFPEVDVRTVLADDEPVAFLGALGARAELLVLGGSARFTRLARLAPSASSILARSAGCPVLVVPPGWPPHRGWLDAQRVGLAGARG